MSESAKSSDPLREALDDLGQIHDLLQASGDLGLAGRLRGVAADIRAALAASQPEPACEPAILCPICGDRSDPNCPRHPAKPACEKCGGSGRVYEGAVVGYGSDPWYPCPDCKQEAPREQQ